MRQMFSKKQIEEICKDLAKNNQLDFSGANFYVKTLTQTQANWQADFPTTILSDYYSALGLEMKHPYFRFQVINNVLRIVLFYRVENNTASAISLNQNDIYGYMSFASMPTWVKKAIYTDKGTTLNQAFSTDADRGIFAFFKGIYGYGDQYRGTYRGDLRVSLNTFESTGNNNIQINISHSASTSIPAGNSLVFSARTFLTLI